MNAKDYSEKAPLTAATYLVKAQREIDELFGDGFAKRNPGLVATFMHTAVADFAMCYATDRLSAALDRIAAALEEKT